MTTLLVVPIDKEKDKELDTLRHELSHIFIENLVLTAAMEMAAMFIKGTKSPEEKINFTIKLLGLRQHAKESREQFMNMFSNFTTDLQTHLKKKEMKQ